VLRLRSSLQVRESELVALNRRLVELEADRHSPEPELDDELIAGYRLRLGQLEQALRTERARAAALEDEVRRLTPSARDTTSDRSSQPALAARIGARIRRLRSDGDGATGA
jgi:hypothetical protein